MFACILILEIAIFHHSLLLVKERLFFSLYLKMFVSSEWIGGTPVLFKEFKKFIVRGNVLDLAIGVIIGAAFSKIIDSTVNDIIMPPIGLIVGKVDFGNLYINLSDKDYSSLAEAQEAGAATINYGLFINNIIHFLIISFVIFMIVKQVNRFHKKEETKKIATKKCPECISEIPVSARRCPACTTFLTADGTEPVTDT